MSIQSNNNILNYLSDPTFTNVNRLFVLSLKRTEDHKDYRDSFSHYYVPKVQTKGFNVLIDRRSFFDLPIKNEEEAYKKIIDMSNNNNYTTNNLLDFAYYKDFAYYIEFKRNYSHQNQIRLLTNSLESSLCDYSDAYILVTGNINVTCGGDDTKVAFKNSAPFEKCRTEINETFVYEADISNITMPMYNLIEYSDNYSDTSGSLWQFRRDEIEGDVDLTIDNAPSFKYKANLIGDTVADGANTKKENVKIAVPLKYLSNFWTLLEMPLINCKI